MCCDNGAQRLFDHPVFLPLIISDTDPMVLKYIYIYIYKLKERLKIFGRQQTSIPAIATRFFNSD
jgi:hypothetical protein